MRQGQPVPACSSLLSDEAISFCAAVTDSSGVASKLEGLLVRKTGRPRQLKVRALLVALLLLALDDRPLHIKAATKLLFYKLPGPWRDQLGINGDATGRKAFLARYRQARYLFHLALSAIDPSPEAKDRVVAEEELAARRKELSDAEVARRQAALEKLLADLLEASVAVCSQGELAGFDGSVGLDATPVPLWSRGPSARRGTGASDPDGGWYVREADGRDGTGPEGKALRKILLGPGGHHRDHGAAAGGRPYLPQLGPGRRARPARPGPGRHRQPPAGRGAPARVAGRVRGGRPRLHPGAPRAVPLAGAGVGLFAGDGLQGD